ncbi:MAG: M18 family aminopeptidase, partial [Treponema sp.]|nr:M18 family aminopeptidase [Candidatus Treponema equifaecale]
MALVNDLFTFIKNSPSCFHAAENVQGLLKEQDFIQLSESEKWNLEPGKKYYASRNGSSVVAFSLPEDCSSKGFRIVASHSDSPSFKIKENPEIKSAGYVTLNVEKYGGMLINPWFDRPLSFAGRVVIQNGEKLCSRLVNVDRDLLMIPSLAIHMSRDANDGHKIDVQKEIQPVLSTNQNATVKSIVAKTAGVEEKDIISADLFL